VAVPQHTQAQPEYGYHDNGDQLYEDQMEVEEQPYRSQADSGQLLTRIKKVRWSDTILRGSADVRS
jgi:hypothetical protein